MLYNTLPVVPRFRPPLTIRNHPLYAVFAANLWEKANPWSATFAVIMYRDARGVSRMDYGVQQREPGFDLSDLWFPDERRHVFVSHREHSITSTPGPGTPSESDWVTDGFWRYEWLEDTQEINGILCRSVRLLPSQPLPENVTHNECWVSTDLSIVIRDILELEGRSLHWTCSLVQSARPRSFDVPGS